MLNRFFAFLLLITCLPLLFTTSLLLLIIDGTPILFFQDRLGLNKTIFRIYKFRTMNDKGITSFGRILRRTGIDEIPQLINIIKGDMNFIGPRPLTEQDVKRLGWDGLFYEVRWNAKPGLSGLAQLSPRCHKKMSFFLDSYYARHRNLLLDLKLIIVSSLAIIIGKKRAKKIYFNR